MDNFELVKSKLPIIDVIGEDLQLKRSGKTYVSLCPFHSEQTPSFHVYPATNTFNCFGCDANGTIIDYIMLRENIKSPSEALEYISRKYNILLENFNSDEWKQRRREIEQNRKQAAMYFKSASRAIEYLAKRGISEFTAKKFGVGFNAKNNSITIPYLNTYGEIVGMAERNLDDGNPKYVNSPESASFKKGNLLFGLDKARKEKLDCVYIVEGYFDVMAMHEMGESRVVAYAGMSLTSEQVNLLSKYITRKTKIYLIPDNDDTGLKEVRKNIALLRGRTRNQIGVIVLPNGCKDMNDYLLSKGKIENLKSEPHEMFLLKQDLETCFEIEDEYEVAREYARQTQNKMIRSEMAKFLAERWKKPLNVVIEHMDGEITTGDHEADLKSFSEAFVMYQDVLRSGEKRKVYTNFTELDKIIKGMKPSEVCSILGRSGAGKTTFVLNLIYNAIMKQKHNVIFNSLELNLVSIVPQLLQIHLNETEGKVANMVLNGEADERIVRFLETVENRLRLVDKGGQTLNDIETYARIANESVFDKPVAMIVIDYFQYIKFDGKKSSYDEKSDGVRMLKEMAKRLNCVIVFLTQANREGGGTGAEKMDMTAARDTGAIEESSDYMLGIYRPAADPKLTEDERQAVQYEMYCQVLKNRWGNIGEVQLRFDGMTKRIGDVRR